MVRRRRFGRRSGTSLVRSVEKLAKGAALIAPAAYKIAESPNRHGLAGAVYSYTGFNIEDGSFALGRLVEGWGPFVAVEIGSRVAHKLIGIVRRI